MTRAAVEAARARLAGARERRAQLELELRRFEPGLEAPRFHRAYALLLALGMGGALAFGAVQRSPAAAPSPAELARRDALRAEHEAAQRRVEATAAPRPEAAAATRADGVLAWTQIGLAACSVKQADLARRAFRKLDFEGYASKRGSDAGAMDPAISQAIRRLDERCREHGIHLLAGP